MHKSTRNPGGFTLIEMLVAVAIMAVTLSSMSIIFKMSIDAYRTSVATAEIMRNLRAITDQLDADFKNISPDSTMFLVWLTEPVTDQDDNIVDYVRGDRIVFFARGNYHSLNEQQTNSGDKKFVMGNTARISYMLTRGPGNRSIHGRDGALARTQHIVTADPAFSGTAAFPGFGSLPSPFNASEFISWNNEREYDSDGIYGWLNAERNAGYFAVLSAISDVVIDDNGITGGGPKVAGDNPATYHMMLCQGIGDFTIQGWAKIDDEYRWFPMIDPAGDGNDSGQLADTDFFVDAGEIASGKACGVILPDMLIEAGRPVTAANYDGIPGLGRAVKFTFTLYDSRGVFKEGRRFTHIVYLGN